MLTINATVPKKVTMPNLVGYSMRQAKAELSSRGLNLGKLIYVDDIATNNVLKQQQRGKDVRPGSSVESGSDIDLVVGLNGMAKARFSKAKSSRTTFSRNSKGSRRTWVCL